MSECILVFPGFARAPSWCHVVVASNDHGRTAVLIGELDDNPGTSVTNALEAAAESVSRELLSGSRDFELYQYVPKGLPSLRPTFYRVEWRGEPRRFSMPTWDVVEDPATDRWLRHLRGRVLERDYISRALISERGLDVIDAREREDLPTAL